MIDREKKIDAVARAICQEQCAFYGETPCWKMVEDGEFSVFPPVTCDEPGCFVLAVAAVESIEGTKR